MLHPARVAIVGTGFFGSSTAYALLMSGLTTEIVLIDRDRRRAEGHVHDLRDAEVFFHNIRVLAGEFGDCCSADVTIITMGLSTFVKSKRVMPSQSMMVFPSFCRIYKWKVSHAI